MTGFAPSAVAALLNDLAALVSRRAAKQRDQRWSRFSKDAAAQAVAAADAEAAAETDESGDAEGNVNDVEWQKVGWCDMQHVPGWWGNNERRTSQRQGVDELEVTGSDVCRTLGHCRRRTMWPLRASTTTRSVYVLCPCSVHGNYDGRQSNVPNKAFIPPQEEDVTSRAEYMPDRQFRVCLYAPPRNIWGDQITTPSHVSATVAISLRRQSCSAFGCASFAALCCSLSRRL